MTDRNTYSIFLFCVCAHGKIKLMRESVRGPTFRFGVSCEIHTESKSQARQERMIYILSCHRTFVKKKLETEQLIEN